MLFVIQAIHIIFLNFYSLLPVLAKCQKCILKFNNGLVKVPSEVVSKVKTFKIHFQRYTISHKVEHQASMGAEVMTRKELADEWIATLVRPGSKLARIRVDPLSNHVLTYETKSLKQLTEHGSEIAFKPGEALGNLHSLFNDLIAAKLTPG